MKTAEQVLNEEVDSVYAWTRNRKRATIRAMEIYAKQIASLAWDAAVNRGRYLDEVTLVYHPRKEDFLNSLPK